VKRLYRLLVAVVVTATVFLFSGPVNAETQSDPRPLNIQGVDLHDGHLAKFGNTYYLYGTMYKCGFQWSIKNTPFCGFGVSTSQSIEGPWSEPKLLFNPNEQDPYKKVSWQTTCGGTGQGCFNPRMIQRTGWGHNDGAFILWFNAPRHKSDGAQSGYNVMGCNGPAGPCGPNAGKPWGSYNKPNLSICTGNGDFGIIQARSGPPAIICTLPGNTGMNIQQLNYWGSGGTALGVTNVASLSHTEGPGGFWDERSQEYVITYSDQGCGYCAGTPIGYATSSSLYSGWTAPGNVGWGAPVYGRRIFNGASCGGQPRTVSVVDGVPYQGVDLWLGTRNETNANLLFSPLDYQPKSQVPGDGQIWEPPLQLDCNCNE